LAQASENEKEENGKERSEESTYFMTRDHLFPMASLQLDNHLLRLSQTLFQRIVCIMKKDAAHQVKAIRDLFQAHGTHYCPSVELGGVWTQEAKFMEKRGFSEGQVRSSISKCFDASAKGGFGFFGVAGFGAGAAAGESQSCGATGEGEGTSSQELARRCFPHLKECPGSDTDFNSAMHTNGNWAVIDRNMPQCVPVWDAIQREHGELANTLEAEGGMDEQRARAAVDEFRVLAEKVWHLHVLDLPGICRSLVGPKHELRSKCDEAEEGAHSAKISLERLEALWEGLRCQAGEDETKRKECVALDYCNNDQAQSQGECQWKKVSGTKTEVAFCSCFPTFTGRRCEEKIAEKKCSLIKNNHCTAHPGNWYQPNCATQHGDGFVYHAWRHCGGVGGVYWQCIKKWTCQPKTSDDDCCSED